jgi:hypothetical protein
MAGVKPDPDEASAATKPIAPGEPPNCFLACFCCVCGLFRCVSVSAVQRVSVNVHMSQRVKNETKLLTSYHTATLCLFSPSTNAVKRAWPKPPMKLVAHPDAPGDFKAPIVVRTPNALGVASGYVPHAPSSDSSGAHAAAAGAGSASANAAGAAPVAAEYTTNEYTLVRASRSEGVCHNLLRFREGSGECRVCLSASLPACTPRLSICFSWSIHSRHPPTHTHTHDRCVRFPSLFLPRNCMPSSHRSATTSQPPCANQYPC